MALVKYLPIFMMVHRYTQTVAVLSVKTDRMMMKTVSCHRILQIDSVVRNKVYGSKIKL